MTLADRIFNAQSALADAEEELYDHLEATLGATECGRLTYDYYDRSFEAYQFEPFDIEITPEQLTAICALGFNRFWLHKTDQRFYGPERAGNGRYFTTDLPPHA